MKRKRRQVENEELPSKADEVQAADNVEYEAKQQAEPVEPHSDAINHKMRKSKQVYSRVDVDPTKRYRTHESRESWGPNVKGKKFRKEKGKKKRCPNAGVRIDGAVKSTRLDA